MANNASEAAAGVLEDMFGEPGNEAPVEPVSPAPTPVAEAPAAPVQETEPAQPVAEDEMPEDIKALLDGPDFEEDDDEPVAPAAQAEPEYDDDEYEDPEVAKLRKRLAAEQKKTAWLEQQRLERERKGWEKEAAKYLPHSEPFLGNINATSKRAFLREARDYHEAVKAHIAKHGQADVERAKEEAKAEAQAAWGNPTTGPGTTPLDVNQAEAQWEEARRKRDPIGMIKARGFHKLID